MKKYSYLFSFLAFCMLSSACEYDYESDTEFTSKSDFAVACQLSGGTFIGENKCQCLENICNDGVVCNMLTKACPAISLPETCAKGQTHCANGKYYVCNEEYNWSVKDDPNCDSYGCLPDNSACAKCSKDVCVDGKLITCLSGVITNTVPCKSNICDDDTKCKPGCNEGEKTCKDNILYTCKNEELVKEKECPAGCDTKTNNTCASNCTEDEKYCADGNVKTCKNGVFDDSTSVSCENGASCKNDKECGECTNGETKCIDDAENAGSIKTCVDGQWNEGTPCKDGADYVVSCKDNKTCGECQNGVDKCVNKTLKSVGYDLDNVGYVYQCTHGVLSEEGTQCMDDTTGNRNSCNSEHTACGECLNGIDFCLVIESTTNMHKCIDGKPSDDIIKICAGGVTTQRGED